VPSSPIAPSNYFDEADLDALVREFSERLRRDTSLRPVLDRLIGNRWEDAEATVGAFLRATLFMLDCPQLDDDWFDRAAQSLDQNALERLGDILLDCALVALPLHSAAVIADIGDALTRQLGDVVALQGAARQDRLLQVRGRLRAGALMARL